MRNTVLMNKGPNPWDYNKGDWTKVIVSILAFAFIMRVITQMFA